ncbi:MAG: phosphoadenosine phosphosulfate reductase family protein [Fibrobacter sp.]|nr:phosphoadenosine phosphosulfate reductase family protein [Fibrobacter sp.]
MTKGIYKRAGGEELKERLAQLATLQALPLPKKIEMSLEIIRRGKEATDGAPACVLYSGGKDSTILIHLVQKVYERPLFMYNNTGLAERRLVQYIRQRMRGLDFIETEPDEEAFTMWKRTGYWPIFGKRSFTARCRNCPGLHVSPVQCCYQLKEAPANRVMKERGIRLAIWGNRADESTRRKFMFCDSGTLFKPKKYPWHQCYPLAFWTQKDVIAYLEDVEPDYPHSMSTEAGCWACCTDITRTPNNIQRLFKTDRARFEYMIRNGFGEIILRAKGIKGGNVEELLRESPQIFLKI